MKNQFLIQSVVLFVLTAVAVSLCAADDGVLPSQLEFYDDLFAGYERDVLFLPNIESAAITVDGKADEKAWQSAATFGDFVQIESALPIPANISTSGKILRGKDGLYIALTGKRAAMPPAYKDADGKVDPIDPAFADHGLDTFALQFNPNINDFTRYRFGVMKGGRTYTLRHFMLPPWKPEGWQAGYHATDSHIHIEFFIPFTLLRETPVKDGDIMAFNVLRYANRLEPVPGGPFRYNIHDTYQWRSAKCHAASPVDHFPWLYFGLKEAFASQKRAPVVRCYLDKSVYDSADEAGESYVEVRFGSVPLDALSLELQIFDSAGKVVAKQHHATLKSPDIGSAFYPALLPAGDYQFRANVLEQDKVIARDDRAFTVTADKPTIQKKPQPIEFVLTDHENIGTGIRPITTGVPFPRGVVFEKDLSNITVERRSRTHDDPNRPWNNEWVPIDTELSVRNRWYRDGSIRWLGVSFDADYYRGRQRAILGPTHPFYPTYRLNLNAPRQAIDKPLTISEDDTQIVVHTGPVKAVVSKTNFQLVSKAWLDINKDAQFEDNELLISASAKDGLLYATSVGNQLTAAGKQTQVRIESAGPMEACIVAEGWYSDENEQEGKHITRLFFRRGQPTIRVHHTYIITVDTHRRRVGNVAARLGIPDANSYIFASEDGGWTRGATESGKSTYLLQYGHDAYAVEKEGASTPLQHGGRTAGWMTAVTPRGNVQLVGRRLWQLFPKELEVGSDFMALHTWPKHGRDVFSVEEQSVPLAVAQARFAHHGKTMDIRLPDHCYETMGHAFSQHLQTRAHEKLIAPRIAGYKFTAAYEARQANGQGIAFTSEWCVRLEAPQAEVDIPAHRAFAKAFKADANAIADPKWTYQSRVFGELWPQDYKRFGSVESAIDSRHQQVLVDLTNRLGDYGQLIWPDYHQYPVSHITGYFDAGWFHRTWTGTHYQEGRTFYLLYLRSGQHRYWQYARDSARHKMDVNTVNYASETRVGKNQTPYGSYHVYGIFGWSGMQGISCHYQNHDYKTWETFLTGDPRGYDQALNWAKEMARTTWVNEPTRDNMVPLSEALEVYQATRYAPLLKTIHWFREAALCVPVEQYVLPHFSQMGWYRMHEYTRDPRVAQRLIEHWGDGNRTKKNGLGHPITKLLTYHLTGDERVLSMMSFAPRRYEVYLPGMSPPSLSRTMMNLPYSMSAMKAIGAPGDVLTDRHTHRTFWHTKMHQWKHDGKTIWGHEIK